VNSSRSTNYSRSAPHARRSNDPHCSEHGASKQGLVEHGRDLLPFVAVGLVCWLVLMAICIVIYLAWVAAAS
jgi:hypothetical protein